MQATRPEAQPRTTMSPVVAAEGLEGAVQARLAVPTVRQKATPVAILVRTSG